MDHAYTRLAAPKLPRSLSAFPYKGAPQAPGDKPNHSKEGYSLGETAPWGSRMRVKVRLDRLPLRPRHTRPNPYTDQRWRLKCVSAQRLPESSAYAPFCWEEEWIGLVFMKEEEYIIV